VGSSLPTRLCGRIDLFSKSIDAALLKLATLRQILGRYLGLAAQEITFSYGAKGKPKLSGKLQKSGLKFNLSHSHELALLAVTRDLAVGIDVELVDHEFATEEIAQHFFALGEVKRLSSIPVNGRADAFFACWTRKEAYIKALGDGLSLALDSFEVAFGPGVPAALMRAQPRPGEPACWSIYDIEVPSQYKAAVAVGAKGHTLRRVPWIR